MNAEDSSDPAGGAEAGSSFDALLREVAAAPKLAADAVAWDLIEGRLSPALTALPSVGDLIDQRYRIVGELGRGGMGIVYAARNERTDRDVALKWMLPRNLLRTATERAESVARFVREARAVSRVDHPNVVRVFDVGGDPDAPYLVMEQLQGESLRKRLERGPLDWDGACRLLLPVMQGVAAVHRAHVIHRDLKPDNIMLTGDVPKVLDFGLSQIRADEADQTLTRTGAVMGTPAFMPLEQLRGGQVDARTDVYALGVIWYQALTQTLPFKASTAADQAVMLATMTPASVQTLRTELRGARSDVVMKALARDPADRWPSVEIFGEAIRRAAEEASSPRRSRWRILALATLVTSLSVAAVWRLRTPGDELARAPALPTPTQTPRATPAQPANVRPVAAPPTPPARELAQPPAPTVRPHGTPTVSAGSAEATRAGDWPRSEPAAPLVARKVSRRPNAPAAGVSDAGLAAALPALDATHSETGKPPLGAAAEQHPLRRNEF